MSKNAKKVFLGLVALSCFSSLFAMNDNGLAGKTLIERDVVSDQNTHRVSGVVKDENGEAIIGASILEVGTTNGIMTDADGRFEPSVYSVHRRGTQVRDGRES